MRSPCERRRALDDLRHRRTSLSQGLMQGSSARCLIDDLVLQVCKLNDEINNAPVPRDTAELEALRKQVANDASGAAQTVLTGYVQEINRLAAALATANRKLDDAPAPTSDEATATRYALARENARLRSDLQTVSAELRALTAPAGSPNLADDDKLRTLKKRQLVARIRTLEKDCRNVESNLASVRYVSKERDDSIKRLKAQIHQAGDVAAIEERNRKMNEREDAVRAAEHNQLTMAARLNAVSAIIDPKNTVEVDRNGEVKVASGTPQTFGMGASDSLRDAGF